jgi:hypothetical protein
VGTNATSGAAPAAFAERIRALPPEHQRGTLRFVARLERFQADGYLRPGHVEVVTEHLIRLGERGRNPANTGNIEDLFCHTLLDTRDPLRAYAQALADSVKIVPMPPDARLWPKMRTRDGSRWYGHVRDFDHLEPADVMLVTHTMVAFGDTEMWSSAGRMVAVGHPDYDDAAIEREVARMAVQSQHLPSSSFVLARAHGLTIDCGALYRAAGYDAEQQSAAQRFYDICSEFDPRWTEFFVNGHVPDEPAWAAWRAAFLDARQMLPPELVYQLSSDTLTNFLDGTLESGKWTDASVFFGGVTSPDDVPEHIARIVNQYIAEHVALHDRPAAELVEATRQALEPWGIGFREQRAVVRDRRPPKRTELEDQFRAAWARKAGT